MLLLPPQLITDMTAWRQHLHRFPECGFDVHLTADFIAEKLHSFGIEVVRGIGQSGLVGILRQGSSSASIGLRADIDALHIREQNTFSHCSQHDGKMHACGHDGHAAMLLGAACYLAQHPTFDGTIYFIFQPDEEHGCGAQAMIDDGLFERFEIDEVYGIHNFPGLAEGELMVRPGSLMASESSFEITITGVGGHAALPHQGIDPLVVGAQVVLGLQTIVSRNLSAIHETAVVSATEFITDGTVNVIPSTVTIKGDCRCFTESALARIEQSMARIVAGICQAAGAEYQFSFTNTFYPTVNSPAQTRYAVEAARQVLGEDRVHADCDPLTISEDFSSMLRVKPGCYVLLGNGTESVGGCALHNPRYDFNDRILEFGARYWIQLVTNRLSPITGNR
ncbi:M20 aminoacylase family protein [Photobacterium sp. TY1-4]|uniref:M20 aminoacylase family protein n=1 Tax=Photobacterium sp. TY1-4 TaxID=2899122 RepID=UPI0021C16528|nr:M20 aminoacylase family protein [Photobacterium sp. TY1-4]UXI04699.1 M20 family metallopeptidase [Photobacterium sp. TY1-4]